MWRAEPSDRVLCVPMMRLPRRLRRGSAVLCKRWRKEPRLPGPPGSTQRERGTKPLQGASVKSGGLERCSKKAEILRQVCATKMSESEPSDDASKDPK